MPDLFRDKRHKGVKEFKTGFEDFVESGDCAFSNSYLTGLFIER
ncbi:MAG: hypothetical protein UU16_C0038G0001, partial [Candidatus Woesebacteria bacterium GW2011_GWA2_40_7]